MARVENVIGSEVPVFSPYEELEYLSDYLPDEGESVLVTREEGELVCKPWAANDLRDGVDDADLYGFLVQSNERLREMGSFPIWVGTSVVIWLAILLHGLLGLHWTYWYLTPGLAAPLILGCVHWIRTRQHQLFLQRILPVLRSELSHRQISYYSLVAGVRQHGELQALLNELIHWTPIGSMAAE